MNRHRQSRGIALITAMLVMALAAIAAAAVLGSAQAAMRRTATLIDGERAWWYADGVESWVLSILERDRREDNIDWRGEKWTTPVTLPVEQGGLSGQLEDLQSRFNLNNLASSKSSVYAQQWQRLFKQLDLEPSQAATLADAIYDWIDSDQIPKGSGAEDNDYRGLDQPYLAANRELRSPSELLAIKGMTRETYQALAPWVTALPLNSGKAPTTVNINTAPKVVLMALSETPNETAIDNWIRDREKEPAKDASKLQGALSADATADMLGVSTEYFLMKVTAFIGSGRVSLYSVVLRRDSAPPIVISRSLDTE